MIHEEQKCIEVQQVIDNALFIQKTFIDLK